VNIVIGIVAAAFCFGAIRELFGKALTLIVFFSSGHGENGQAKPPILFVFGVLLYMAFVVCMAYFFGLTSYRCIFG
jgi:hypothetical protein